jgi:hypothetical protein
VGGLKGEALANAEMKAVTKAKRRLTLSICGLGWLDETEISTVPDAEVVPSFHEEPSPPEGEAPIKLAAYERYIAKVEELLPAIPPNDFLDTLAAFELNHFGDVDATDTDTMSGVVNALQLQAAPLPTQIRELEAALGITRPAKLRSAYLQDAEKLGKNPDDDLKKYLAALRESRDGGPEAS